MEKEKQNYLYESSVQKEVVDKITEAREENGEKIEVTKEVKVKKPIKIAILKPDRKKYKEAEIFYAKSLSNYLKEGLLPYSLVSKRYMNDGGPLTDEEIKDISSLRNKYNELQEEYFKMQSPLSDEQTKRRSQIILEMTEINSEIKKIKNSYSEIFENTAEYKAKNDTIEWWILNLSFVNEDNSEYKPLYGDKDYDSKMNTLEKLESKNDLFTNELIKKLSFFISFWYNSSGDLSNEDFKVAEEHYNNNVSNYLKEEAKENEKS
jgi:hypothetical protein